MLLGGRILIIWMTFLFLSRSVDMFLWKKEQDKASLFMQQVMHTKAIQSLYIMYKGR